MDNSRKGDKQMLIDTIKRSYRDLIRHTDPIQPIVTVPNDQPAANASNFSKSEVQVRRQRRQRRMARALQQGSVGWSVRTW
jgi:hypothetical protein